MSDLTFAYRIGVEAVNDGFRYSLIQVYSDDGIPVSWDYADKCLQSWSDPNGFKGEYIDIGMALHQPFLDLDSFPKQFNVTQETA